jgi:hypothetical protein
MSISSQFILLIIRGCCNLSFTYNKYYILPTWRVLYSPYVKSIIFSPREEYYILPTWRVLYSPYVKSIIFPLREEYYILPTWRVLYSPYVKSIIFSLREEYYILHTWRVLYSPYVKSIIFSLREEYYILHTWSTPLWAVYLICLVQLADVCFSWVVHVLKAEKLGPGLEPTICRTNDVVPLHLRMLPLLKMTIS